MACVRVQRKKGTWCLQKMVAVYLPREDRVSQRVTQTASHRTLKFQQRNLGGGSRSLGRTNRGKRHASAVGAILQLKICPKADNLQLIDKETRS